ncbi:MAG: SigmaK-factor processing regulatory BofA [Syntrophomonadaceae bacterium]|nr:SigmaK-factor processing regulatory BofA [Syntrophomonadaceae bacterium]
MSTGLWVILVIGIIAIILLQAFIKPAVLIVKLVVKSGIGIALIVIFNFLGGIASLALPFNPATVLIAGFLGIPGLMLLTYLQYILQ